MFPTNISFHLKQYFNLSFRLREPCEGCEAPYGYKHQMDLAEDTSTFAGQVKRAQVSGNLVRIVIFPHINYFLN